MPRHRPLSASLSALCLLWPAAAAAQTVTALSVPDVTGSYSDAVDVVVRLTAGGAGVADATVVINVRDAASTFNIDAGQVTTAGDGRATVRIPLVNGCPLWGSTQITGGTTAAPQDYVVEASFSGDTLSGTAYTGSVGQGSLHVIKSSAQVVIVSGTSAALGDMLTITAKIVDDDGDAPCDRSALHGPGPSTVAGHRLAFFWDVTADHDYSDARENLGSAITARANPQADATASVTTDTSPVNNQPRAGILDGALQVQLPADDAVYLPATAVGRLILLPAPLAPERTTLKADPDKAQAGGSAPVEITVTLRDKFDNALGIDAAEHAVKVEIDGAKNGASMQGSSAKRDPATGLYKQTLLAPARKGPIKVKANVDGVDGGSLEIPFSGIFPVGPCACARTNQHVPAWGWMLMVLPLLLCRHVRPRMCRRE